jgi:hypothetical protein
VAEEPSSEPTAENYNLREESARYRGVLRWFCGSLEQSDTAESCGVAWRREWDSNPRYGFPHTRFPSVRLKPLGHLSGGLLLKGRDGFCKGLRRPLAAFPQPIESTGLFHVPGRAPVVRHKALEPEAGRLRRYQDG